MALTKTHVTFKYTDEAAKFVTTAKTDHGVLVYETGDTRGHIAGQKHGVLAVNGTIIGGGIIGVTNHDNALGIIHFDGTNVVDVSSYTTGYIDTNFKVADFAVKDVANNGYLKSYEVTKVDGSKVDIDIPKDFLLKDAHVCTFTKNADDTYTDSETGEKIAAGAFTAAGLKEGVPAFHFIINVQDDTEDTKRELYVSMDKLMPKSYTAGAGITLTDTQEFYVDKTYTYTEDVNAAFTGFGTTYKGIGVTETDNETKVNTLKGYLVAKDFFTYVGKLDTSFGVVSSMARDISTRLKTHISESATKFTQIDTSITGIKANITTYNASINTLTTRLNTADASINALEETVDANNDELIARLDRTDASCYKNTAAIALADSSITDIKADIVDLTSTLADVSTAVDLIIA